MSDRYPAVNGLSGKRNCEGQLSCPANAKSLRRYPGAVEIGDEWDRAVPGGRRWAHARAQVGMAALHHVGADRLMNQTAHVFTLWRIGTSIGYSLTSQYALAAPPRLA